MVYKKLTQAQFEKELSERYPKIYKKHWHELPESTFYYDRGNYSGDTEAIGVYTSEWSFVIKEPKQEGIAPIQSSVKDTTGEATMWICCKCQKIYMDYPPNSTCECGNEDDFFELELETEKETESKIILTIIDEED